MKKKLIYICFLLCSLIVNSQDFGLTSPAVQSIHGSNSAAGPYGIPNRFSFGTTVNLNNTIEVFPALTILSGPETGYHGWDINQNDMGIMESITVMFAKDVSVIEVYTYVFRLESSTIETTVVSDFTINVTFYPENSCQLDAPSNIEFTDITETSARINWSNVSGNNGYDVDYVAALTNGTTPYVYTSTSSLSISDLLPNTTYLVFLKTICSTGFTSQKFNYDFFHTLPVCESDIIVTEDVNGYDINYKSAEFTITATNKIFEGIKLYDAFFGGVANYNAGERVLLKPGFHAESGSTFRAFIEGCSTTSAKSIDTVEKQEVLKEENVLLNSDTTIYPNPTTGIFTISSNEVINSYMLFNSYGSILLNKTVGVSKVAVNIQNLSAGVYVLKISLASGKVLNKKIIKK